EVLGVNESFTFTATFKVCTGLGSNGKSVLTETAIATGVDCSGNLVTSGNVTSFTCVEGCALAVTVFPHVPTNVCQGGSITLSAVVTGNCASLNNLIFQWFDPDNTLVGTGPTLVINSDVIPCPPPSQWTVVVTDPDTGCMATGMTAPLCVIPCGALAISKTARVSGNLITYTLSVTNNGPNPSFVTITDCLDACLSVLMFNNVGTAFWNAVVTDNCITAI